MSPELRLLHKCKCMSKRVEVFNIVLKTNTLSQWCSVRLTYRTLVGSSQGRLKSTTLNVFSLLGKIQCVCVCVCVCAFLCVLCHVQHSFRHFPIVAACCTNAPPSHIILHRANLSWFYLLNAESFIDETTSTNFNAFGLAWPRLKHATSRLTTLPPSPWIKYNCWIIY